MSDKASAEITPSKHGVILINLGTPSEPTSQAVRHFLREFLSDRRVVGLSPWLWLPLLYGVILPRRSPRVAKNYRKIWLREQNKSPLLYFSEQQAEKLQKRFDEQGQPVVVRCAMTYGNPSLSSVWQEFKRLGITRVSLLPLYPQYSSSTSAPTLDAWSRVMGREFALPDLHWIRDYHQHPLYIRALAESVRQSWQQGSGQSYLLISCHGIPVRYQDQGDPYPQQCQQTATLLARELGLEEDQWSLTFQSRFGKEPWITPYTDEVLQQLPAQGIRNISVICPSFSVDCLETLEEIADEGQALFLKAGGEQFNYIAALNDSKSHIELFYQLIQPSLR